MAEEIELQELQEFRSQGSKKRIEGNTFVRLFVADWLADSATPELLQLL
jgi:hypothetical protein